MGIGLDIELEEIEHRVILRIDGRLDAPSAPILERKLNALIDEKRYSLFLDFSRVDYLSSAGIRVLLAELKKVKAKGGDLVLFSISDEVMEVIKMAGFDKVLRIFPNEKEALHH